jgi:cytochrome c556
MKSWHVAAPVMAGLLLGAALTFAPAVSQAEDSATIVHERQQLMKDFGSAMKTIGGISRAALAPRTMSQPLPA